MIVKIFNLVEPELGHEKRGYVQSGGLDNLVQSFYRSYDIIYLLDVLNASTY